MRSNSPHIDVGSHRRDGRVGWVIPVFANTAVFTMFDVKGMHDESLLPNSKTKLIKS